MLDIQPGSTVAVLPFDSLYVVSIATVATVDGNVITLIDGRTFTASEGVSIDDPQTRIVPATDGQIDVVLERCYGDHHNGR